MNPCVDRIVPTGFYATLLLALSCFAYVAAADEDDSGKLDLATIEPGRGVVFGSIEVQWPDRPALSKGPGGDEKFVEIRRLDSRAQGNAHGDASFMLKVPVGQERPFLKALEAGDYMMTCLYHRDAWVSQPVGPCHALRVRFSVVEGEVAYVGKTVVVMPSKVLSFNVSVRVLDEPEIALTALTPKFGQGLAAATHRLAGMPPAKEGLAIETGDFPRLAQSMRQPQMIHHEENPGTYSLTRFAIAGRSGEEWEIALEILDTRRADEPPTPIAWFERHRSMVDEGCQSEWVLLETTDSSVTFERRSPDCPQHAAQESLYRVLYGQDHAFIVICTQAGRFDAQTRQECGATLAGATVQRD